jgi:spermidine/putrescine transport system substrate-binding protein
MTNNSSNSNNTNKNKLNKLAADNSIPSEIKNLISKTLSRRTVLAGVGGAGAAVALASCSSGGSSAENIRWANWTEYLDYDEATGENPSLVDFAKANGIEVSYKEAILDNDEFTAPLLDKLQSKKDIGYDLVTLTDWMTARWIRLGYTAKFTEGSIPNKANLISSLQNPSFDPGRTQSLPWQGIMAGVGWNTEKIPGGVKSIEQLFSPKNKGKVVVLSEMRDTMGLILNYLGIDPSKDFTEDQFMKGIEFLDKKVKEGIVIGVRGNEYTQDLRDGNVWAVIGWSGDMFQLKAESEGKFDFALPEEGGIIANDNLMIPATATNNAAVEKLINYYYDPAIAAKVAAFVNYVCPVDGAQAEMAKFDAELAASEFIFPTEKTKSQLKIFRALTAAEETKFQTAFQSVAGNA